VAAAATLPLDTVVRWGAQEVPPLEVPVVHQALEPNPYTSPYKRWEGDAVVSANQATEPDPFTYTPRELPKTPDNAVPTTRLRRDRQEPDEARPSRRKQAVGDEDRDDLRDLRVLKKEDTMLSVISMILGIVASVFGVFSMCCCGGVMTSPIAGIGGAAAIVLGVMGQKRGGRGYAVTGISLGVVGVLFALGSIAFLALGIGMNMFGAAGGPFNFGIPAAKKKL
jgi:hypothetical protein